MKPVRIHDKRRILDDFFKVDAATVSYEGFDGRTIGPVRRLSLERGDSVAALVVNRDRNCAILATQFRYPTLEKGPGWLTEIPAGMVESGETTEACIRREVREESGYEIARLEPIGTFYLSPGGSSERTILYYAEVTDAGRVGPGGGQASEGEDIRVVEVSIDELERDALAGRLADAKTLVAILWLIASRRRGEPEMLRDHAVRREEGPALRPRRSGARVWGSSARRLIWRRRSPSRAPGLPGRSS